VHIQWVPNDRFGEIHWIRNFYHRFYLLSHVEIEKLSGLGLLCQSLKSQRRWSEMPGQGYWTGMLVTYWSRYRDYYLALVAFILSAFMVPTS